MSTTPVTTVPKPVATQVVSEETVKQLLAKVAVLEAKADTAATKATTPSGPPPIDWSKVTEREATDLNFYIPVIEHELPDYMSIHLKDNNYVARWIHQMPRHVGTKLAQGYEFIKTEHWDPNFPQILAFDAEGHLRYDDVIAVRVHKSLYFGALRRAHLKSTQVSNVMGMNKVKGETAKAVINDSHLEAAIRNKGLTFYGETVESAIEEQVNI